MIKAYAWTLTSLFLAFATALLPADVIRLQSGGVIHGRVVEEESDDEWLTVELENTKGAKIRIKRAQVKEILTAETLQDEYEALKAKLGDGFEAHLELARWCHRHGLRSETLRHLKEAAKLKPDSPELRRVAAQTGYLRAIFPDRDAPRRPRRSAAQRKLAEKRREEQAAKRQWMKQLAELKELYLTGKPLAQEGVRQRLSTIDDPRAIDAVVKWFLKDDRAPLRALGCLALTKIPGPRATTLLVERLLEDESEDVRWAAIDALKGRDDPLRIKKLTAALRSGRNHEVRLAALALGEIGDPDAVPALINALVTEHWVRKPPRMGVSFGGVPSVVPGLGQGSSGGEITLQAPAGLTPIVAYPIGQGAGIQAGGAVLRVKVQNPEVLEALKKLTGEDFGYDEKAWKEWYRRRGAVQQERVRRQLSLP